MRIKLLGASAGGGFPQWNCTCPNCQAIRKGGLKSAFRGQPRSQSQLALSADLKSWFLLNASPDLRMQIEAHPELHPRAQAETQAQPQTQARHTPISAVVLTNADLDHVLGLLLMRESQPLRVYATPSVRRILTEDNSMFKMLNQTEDQVKWTDILPDQAFELVSVRGEKSGMSCTPISVSTKYPIYVSPARKAELSADEAVLALMVEDTHTRKKMAYLPGISGIDDVWLKRLNHCDLVFCDGTFWTDDELKKISAAPQSVRTSREMGHIPMSGPDGSIQLLSRLTRPTKVYTHINNTNPVLNELGPEYQETRKHGIEVGYDGMEFDL